MKEALNKIASPEEKKRYILSEEKDYMILEKIHELETKNLSTEDKKLVKFIRTQLEKEWRTPIIKFLDKLLGKYKK